MTTQNIHNNDSHSDSHYRAVLAQDAFDDERRISGRITYYAKVGTAKNGYKYIAIAYITKGEAAGFVLVPADKRRGNIFSASHDYLYVLKSDEERHALGEQVRKVFALTLKTLEQRKSDDTQPQDYTPVSVADAYNANNRQYYVEIKGNYRPVMRIASLTFEYRVSYRNEKGGIGHVVRMGDTSLYTRTKQQQQPMPQVMDRAVGKQQGDDSSDVYVPVAVEEAAKDWLDMRYCIRLRMPDEYYPVTYIMALTDDYRGAYLISFKRPDKVYATDVSRNGDDVLYVRAQQHPAVAETESHEDYRAVRVEDAYGEQEDNPDTAPQLYHLTNGQYRRVKSIEFNIDAGPDYYIELRNEIIGLSADDLLYIYEGHPVSEQQIRATLDERVSDARQALAQQAEDVRPVAEMATLLAALGAFVGESKIFHSSLPTQYRPLINVGWLQSAVHDSGVVMLQMTIAGILAYVEHFGDDALRATAANVPTQAQEA